MPREHKKHIRILKRINRKAKRLNLQGYELQKELRGYGNLFRVTPGNIFSVNGDPRFYEVRFVPKKNPADNKFFNDLFANQNK